MAVTNETIINKMIKELNDAKKVQYNQDKMVKHIANIRLLCDLFLEEEPAAGQVDSVESNHTSEFSPEEVKAMLGKEVSETKPSRTQKSTIDHDDANGDSIFDF
ncbi:YwdI family protein [Virgibacillus ainsalahensis]